MKPCSHTDKKKKKPSAFMTSTARLYLCCAPLLDEEILLSCLYAHESYRSFRLRAYCYYQKSNTANILCIDLSV